MTVGLAVRRFELAEAERTHARRVTHGDELVRRQDRERVRTVDLGERVDELIVQRLLAAAGDEVQHHLGVARALKDAATRLELGAQRVGVREVAVVGECQRRGAVLEHQRLRVAQAPAAGGRIPHVTNGRDARQTGERLVREHVADEANRAVHAKRRAFAGHDAGAFLTTVLQRVQPEVREVLLPRGARKCQRRRTLRRHL